MSKIASQQNSKDLLLSAAEAQAQAQATANGAAGFAAATATAQAQAIQQCCESPASFL
jgi:hypothetical protein